MKWGYILLGLGLIVATFIMSSETIFEQELTEITIEVKTELESGSRRSGYAYRFWSANYACKFLIPKAGAIAANWSNLENIQPGEFIYAQIISSNKSDLYDKNKRVRLYSVSSETISVYSLLEFNDASYLRTLRLKYFGFSLGFIFLFHGVFRSKKWNMAIIGISVAIIVVLRFLHIWLY